MKKYSLFLAVLVFAGQCSAIENNSENLTDAEAFAKLVGGKNVYVGSDIKGYFSADGTEFNYVGSSVGPYIVDKESIKSYGTLGFDASYTRHPYVGYRFSSVIKSGGKYSYNNRPYDFTFR